MAQQSIAVIGASKDRRKFGNKAVRAYLQQGFTVFPVNGKETSIEGLKCYPKIEDIAEPVSYVSLYVPPAIGIRLLDSIANKHPQELWLNPGTESDELLEQAADLKLRVLVACSITAIGMDPDAIPDA